MTESLERSGRIAWVQEDTEWTARGFCGQGTFSAHIEGDGVDLDDPPAIWSESVDEVLTWARARALRVVVRYVEPTGQPGVFTAGDEPARTNLEADGPAVELPSWPPPGVSLAPGRNPGWEFMERTDRDAPIQWDVVLQVYAPGDPIDPAPLVAALRSHQELCLLDWCVENDGCEVLRALVSVTAPARGAAEAAVLDAAVAAVENGFPELGPPGHAGAMRWSAEASAFPTGSDAATWNAKIR